MREETPKCKDCGQFMFEIGGTGKYIQDREQKLYQCPEDKTIELY